MIEVLQQQYALTQRSRELVFGFIETKIDDGFNKPIPAYDGKTIRYLLVHNARCYLHWLSFFAMRQPFEPVPHEGYTTPDLMRGLYRQVDDTVAVFLEHFKEKMDIRIKEIHDDGYHDSATPLQLFTHVMTHEFHHKGQVLSMFRLLGHVPPDTDVSMSFETW